MLPILDIFSFCQANGLEYAEAGHHHCHEGWVQLHCVFCAGGHGGFHLGFSLERGNFNCWRCGGHSAWETVGALLRTSDKSQIFQAFTKHARKDQIFKVAAQLARKRSCKPPMGAGPLHKRHKNYLRSRGFNVTRLVEEWDLLGTRHLGKWSWRVVAPICESSGRIVAYVGRTIRDVKPKYKVTENEKCLVDPKSLLYGIHKVPGDSVVIVEGPADVWRLGPGAVATLGIDWKRAQASALRKFKRRFVLFDSVDKSTGEADKRAERRARKLAEFLSMFSGTTEIVSGFDTDPGDFTDNQARRVMRELLGAV